MSDNKGALSEKRADSSDMGLRVVWMCGGGDVHLFPLTYGEIAHGPPLLRSVRAQAAGQHDRDVLAPIRPRGPAPRRCWR